MRSVCVRGKSVELRGQVRHRLLLTFTGIVPHANELNIVTRCVFAFSHHNNAHTRTHKYTDAFVIIIFYCGNITDIFNMACSSGDKFRIQSNDGKELTASSTTINTCTATKILDRLHREFTEKYAPSSGTVPVGKTAIADIHRSNPTFYLRKQPKLSSFFSESSDGQEINRFNNMLSTNPPKTENDQQYRTMIHSIMNGDYKDQILIDDYNNPPPTSQINLSNPASFKGFYGLVNLNNVLETQIDSIINGMTGSETTAKATSDIANKYAQRRGIQTTLETIASRENEIYREKFLNLILIVLGIFLVGTQLVNKYFSFGGGGSGVGSGGGLFGNLFTGYGVGASSGIFSRFGGLGLGRSGRSRVTGMFSNNPYSLSTR